MNNALHIVRRQIIKVKKNVKNIRIQKSLLLETEWQRFFRRLPLQNAEGETKINVHLGAAIVAEAVIIRHYGYDALPCRSPTPGVE